MSAILRLYPRAWRERYGDEIAAVLADRPPTTADLFDLLRGVLDARLHPRLPEGAAIPEREFHMNSRLPAFAALGAGTLWLGLVINGIVTATSPPIEGSAQETVGSMSLWGSFFLMLAAVIGSYMAPFARRVLGGAAALGLASILAFALPWPLGALGLIAIVGIAGSSLLLLATVRVGLWPSMAAAAIIGLGAVVPLLLGLLGASVQSPLMTLVLAPFGIAWLVVGVLMLRRYAAPAPRQPRPA